MRDYAHTVGEVTFPSVKKQRSVRTMKNLGNIIVATAITLPVVAGAVDIQAIEALVKRTEISPKNAEGGIEKLIKT
ncbi:MAG: hypothetical protein ACK5Q1_13565, partial [Limnobacter sp.]